MLGRNALVLKMEVTESYKYFVAFIVRVFSVVDGGSRSLANDTFLPDYTVSNSEDNYSHMNGSCSVKC